MNRILVLVLILLISGSIVVADEREEAMDAITEIKSITAELSQLNLSTLLMNDMLTSAQRSFGGHIISRLRQEMVEEGNPKVKPFLEEILEVVQKTPGYELKKRDYSEVLSIASEAKQVREQALITADSVSLAEEEEYAFRLEGIPTNEGRMLIEQAKEAASQERFSDALALVSQSKESLEKAGSEYRRQSGITELSKNFVQRYRMHILLAMLIFGAAAAPVWKRYQKLNAKRKVHDLKMEQRTIQILLKKAQHDYLVTKKMTKSTFEIRTQRLKKRITEIKHTLPVLEAIAKGRNPKKQKERPVQRGVIEVKR